MYIECVKCRIYPVAVILTSMVGSICSPVYAEERPFVQDFVVTAYYSPLPNQCCYFRGGYLEEIAFNGNGTHGADGTPVYPGMMAGPPSYAFGTIIDVPGVGVGTVHDRGGRIVEWGDDVHRIDIWMGHGEEGLARALAWGVRSFKGTVYPPGTEAPPENINLASLNADSSVLASLPKSDPVIAMQSAKIGDVSYSVRTLQSTLRELGYFHQQPTGQFGPVTQEALADFQSDYGMEGDGSEVDVLTVAALLSASEITDANLPDLSLGLAVGNRGADVRQAQKLLRYLGYYRGRTDGVYDRDVVKAVLKFQMETGVISKHTDAGAGRIGPATKAEILQRWKGKIVATKSRNLARKMEVKEVVLDERVPTKYLSKNDRGNDVKLLQSFLHEAGYLPPSDRTGTFGSRTESALLQYQMDKKIIASAGVRGAGIFGPATKAALTNDILEVRWQAVRADGMSAL